MRKNFIVSFFTLFLIGFIYLIVQSNEDVGGKRLPQPEEGWKRYNDNGAFIYNGTWEQGKSSFPKAFHNGDHTGSKVKGDTIEFEFKGTQLRVLTRKGPDRPKELRITVDGEEVDFSAYNKSHTNGFDVVYEKIGLADVKHKIKIENGKGMFLFDAIDINEDGELLEPSLEPEKPIKKNINNKLYVSGESMYKLIAGEIYSWGENKYGQLGLGDTKKRSLSAKEKVNISEKIENLVVGKNFVIALGESGKVYGWGDNTSELFTDQGELVLSPVEFDEGIESIIKAE